MSDQMIITLNVGGTKFTTSASTLTARKGTWFEVMLNSSWPVRRDAENNIFIDRSPLVFDHVLNLLRGQSLPWTSLDLPTLQALKSDIDYFSPHKYFMEAVQYYIDQLEGNDKNVRYMIFVRLNDKAKVYNSGLSVHYDRPLPWAVKMKVNVTDPSQLLFFWKFPQFARWDFVINAMGMPFPNLKYRTGTQFTVLNLPRNVTAEMTHTQPRSLYAYTQLKALKCLPPRTVWFINDHLEEISMMQQLIQTDTTIMNDFDRFWSMTSREHEKIVISLNSPELRESLNKSMDDFSPYYTSDSDNDDCPDNRSEDSILEAVEKCMTSYYNTDT